MPGAEAFKRPVSVLVVVATAGGEALLLRRREPADFWQSVTGSLERGEAPESAARRELYEETGIAAVPVATGRVNRFPIHPAWRARYRPQDELNEEHVFVVHLDGRVAVRLAYDEHTEFAWLTRDAAVARAWSWTDQEALKALIPSG
ncbi:MAG: dihydroneopterin triphosphate diphosphatase [Gammaproteobacteria bacterium]|nr:dihydroneopterin triphosphate diphosphatase [Gammaproteobacteria bacterium]